ncbi:MAG: glycosyltransferase family 1 protein [Bacteroidia bacterium]|nr:glycosyltransferase family 1 protein [Bacteroidia bacterium]
MNTSKNINFIAFDVPYPANYGGVIDIFYKITELKKLGYNIYLHCFQYGRKKSEILKQHCKKVHYYPRKTFKNLLIGDIPYIVASRQNDDLLYNLNQNSYPILFEGLHTTFLIKHQALKHRFKIVRTHNIEHDYYKHLELAEKNFFKKYFFKIEAERLKKYQNILRYADLICAISPSDFQYFNKKFGKTIYLPAFHSNEEVKIKIGKGNYVLYHGNLSVAENHQAAMLLVNEVFSKITLPLIIAGSNPKKELKQAIDKFKNIELKAGESVESINNLISNAQINLLYTKQDTGIKLKLLNSLFLGRHCIANSKMTDNTGLEILCFNADTPEKIIELVNKYFNVLYSDNEVKKRTEFFKNNFRNKNSAQILDEILSNNVLPENIKLNSQTATKKSKLKSLNTILNVLAI